MHEVGSKNVPMIQLHARAALLPRLSAAVPAKALPQARGPVQQLPPPALGRPRSTGTPYPIGITPERAVARRNTHHLPGHTGVGTLTQDNLSALLQEVVHDVREATGWGLRLPQHQALSRAQWVRQCVDALPATASPNERRRTLEEATLFAESTLACYEPDFQLITVIVENVRSMNHDFLRSLLHHELVHTAQHQRYPQFVDLGKRMLLAAELADEPQRAQAARLLYSMRKLEEGHAHLLERRARTRYYPQAAWHQDLPWTPGFLQRKAARQKHRRYLQTPYAGAEDLEQAEKTTPLHTVLKRLYGNMQATAETFRTPQERRALARQASEG